MARRSPGYHNLREHPIVTVEAAGEKFKARDTVVDGDDYERIDSDSRS